MAKKATQQPGVEEETDGRTDAANADEAVTPGLASRNSSIVKMSLFVWEDYLDPESTGMQAELELPPPTFSKYVVTFDKVPYRTVLELAGYMRDRASMLEGQVDPSERRVHRAALKVADAIEDAARTARRSGTLPLNSSTNAIEPKGSIMPKVTRKASAKAATKPSTAKAGSTKTAAAKTATKEAPVKTRRTQEDVDALVPQFLEKIGEGATLRAIKQEFGFSDDGPIRAALYRAGYDRKGEEHGEEAESIDAKKAAGKKQVVKLRTDEGAAWYRLAYLTGLSEPEVKAIVADAGGPTGRVYREPAPKPAAKPKVSKAAKAKAKAADEDPSDQD